VAATAPSTRERILEIALDLFIEKGYDNTSLRDIAEALGYTKAAIYYHFPSKNDIFMALHLQLHELFSERLRLLATDESATLEAWAALLQDSAASIVANQKLLALHERNRTSFEIIHSKDHLDDHEDLDDRLRALASDPTRPLRDRVRVVCAVGALMGSVMLIGTALTDVDGSAVAAELRSAIGDLLGPS
jgi:AcrR family transcriptional regulator